MYRLLAETGYNQKKYRCREQYDIVEVYRKLNFEINRLEWQIFQYTGQKLNLEDIEYIPPEGFVLYSYDEVFLDDWTSEWQLTYVHPERKIKYDDLMAKIKKATEQFHSYGNEYVPKLDPELITLDKFKSCCGVIGRTIYTNKKGYTFEVTICSTECSYRTYSLHPEYREGKKVNDFTQVHLIITKKDEEDLIGEKTTLNKLYRDLFTKRGNWDDHRNNENQNFKQMLKDTGLLIEGTGEKCWEWDWENKI